MSAITLDRPVNPPLGAGKTRGNIIAGLARVAIGRMAVRSLLLAITSGACKGDGVSGVAGSSLNLLPEKPGQFIAAGVLPTLTRLRWDTDEEITYAGLDELAVRAQLRAVHVANGRVRVIDGAPSREAQYSDFQVSQDGRHTFFVLSGSLYFAVTDSARVLIANIKPVGNEVVRGLAVLPGADVAQVVYGTETDSIWIYDARTRARRFLTTGCGTIVSASPDGRQALCWSYGQTPSIVDIGSGAVSMSNTFTSASSEIKSIHWGPRGIEHIRSGALYLTELVNGASGAVTTVIASRQTQSIDFTNHDDPVVNSMAWSRDGRSIAYSRSLWYCRGVSCVRRQSQLYVFDVESRATRLAAVVEREIGSITFSPDGARIAYLAYADGGSSAIYVAPLP